MERFHQEFPALDFSFSQLIRDNVEEALSGVKGANSVKLFGSDLEVLETNRREDRRHPAVGTRHSERGCVSHRGPAQPRDRDRP